jgi:hypothetical protein
MNRLPIDKVFTLLTFEQEPPSRGHIFRRIWPSICRLEQNFTGIAGFSVKHNLAATANILPEKILTSQNSQALHEMAYFDVKGRGENDKYKNRAELQ